MATKTGVIEVMGKDNKRFKIGEEWFSAFSISQMNDVKLHDSVTFTYTTTVKGENTYNNIKGNVTRNPPGTVGATEASSPSAASAAPPRASSSYSKGAFPVPALDGSRSIIRQNALTQANTAASNYYGLTGFNSSDFPTAETYADHIIELARKFEAYSAGDLDAKLIEDMMADMVKKEAHE